MKNRGAWLCCLFVFTGFAVGPPAVRAAGQDIKIPQKTLQIQPLPDLRIRSFELYGEPVLSNMRIGGKNVQAHRQRFRLVVENAGQAAALGEHRIGIFHEASGRPLLRVLLERGAQLWHLSVSRLDPLQRMTLDGYLLFTEEFAGTQGRVYAVTDIIDQEFMPAYGRIRETNEDNNGSARLEIRLPAMFRPASPPAEKLQMLPPRTFELTEAFLDILGSVIRGELHLNNDNGHSDSDHFTGTNPFRSNDSRIRVNDDAETFSLPEFSFETGGMHYHYYVRDLDAEFGGGAGFRGRDLLGLQGGNLVLTIRFETAGRVELRGWEYTAGTFYDLSAPDIDITRMDIFVHLTPFLKEDGIFTYSDARVMTDLQVSFIGAYDTVFMNDILGRIRSRMTAEINAMLRAIILRNAIKWAFEAEAMRAFHGLPDFHRLVRMTAAGDRIIFEYR